MSLLDSTRRELLRLGTLTGKIAKNPVGEPAIYQGQWAPTSAARPYVLLNLRTNPTEQLFMRGGALTIDVFGDGPFTRRVEEIARLIVERLDSGRVEDPESGEVYRFGEALADDSAPTEDNATARWRAEIPVRFWRGAFLEVKQGVES